MDKALQVVEQDTGIEITPDSQIFDVLSSDGNSQEGMLTMHNKQDDNNKAKRGEDMETKVFENGLYVVFDISREPLGTVLILKSFDDDNVPLHFRLTMRGLWVRTPIDHGDIVRVIGKFKKSN